MSIRRITMRTAAAIGLAVLALTATLSLTTQHSYVTTPSMWPTIPPGSEIIIGHPGHYHPGQVIVFRANGLIWAHRLISIDARGGFHTKGDNPANAPDVFPKPVTAGDVVGVVDHAPRWVGFPELILRHPSYGLAWLRTELGLTGRMLVVGFTALLSLLGVLRPGSKRGRGRHATPSIPVA